MTLVIERQVHLASFGLGLWDVTAGRLVSEGLAVTVSRRTGGRALDPVDARPNRGGVFAAHGLPALRAVEAGDAADALPHLVEVRDTTGRYLPFALAVDLPAPGGIVRPPCADEAWPDPPAGASPPPRAAWLPLLHAPAYPVPAGFAALRAACVDDASGAPAAHAVIELRHDGRLIARAVSDARGEALAVFPYPPPPDAPIFAPGSPAGPPSPATPLADTTWPIEIAVRWRRDLPLLAAAGGRDPLPELCALLAQPIAEASDDASPPMPLRDATLRHGRDLVLAEAAGARLRIRPA